MEDLPGFWHRLVENSKVYLTFFYEYLGLRPEFSALSLLLTLFTYVLFFVCIIPVYKRNKSLFFVGLYAGIMNVASFIILQTRGMQYRLIMIYVHLMLRFLLGGIYFWLSTNNLRKLALLSPALLILLCVSIGVRAKDKGAAHIPVLQHNLTGDMLYGLTPDWENFVKMCQWTTKNLDKNAVVVSRKPSISYIYTGKQFEAVITRYSTFYGRCHVASETHINF